MSFGTGMRVNDVGVGAGTMMGAGQLPLPYGTGTMPVVQGPGTGVV